MYPRSYHTLNAILTETLVGERPLIEDIIANNPRRRSRISDIEDRKQALALALLEWAQRQPDPNSLRLDLVANVLRRT